MMKGRQTMATASDHFRAGQLADAIAALNEEVKARPTDIERRTLLADFLVVAGDVERADRTLDVIGRQNPDWAAGIALVRRLLRGALARQEVFADGRVPEFLADPPEHLQLHLKALLALRDGDGAAAAALLDQAEAARPAVAGVLNEETAFDDFRDADDTTASFFEVITGGGDYYWVPFESVASVEFHAPERPRDLVFRKADLEVHDGPSGEVTIPAIYLPPDGAAPSDAMRLGRITEWLEIEGGHGRGLGQRLFLVGEEGVPISQIRSLGFRASGASALDAALDGGERPL